MLEQILIGLALVVLGGVITNAWSRYKSRVTPLRYYVWHQFFGSTVDDPHFGTVEVKYGGSQVKSLYVSTVQLANDSNRDLTNLELNIACDSDTSLLTSRAVVSGSMNTLDYSQRFLALLPSGDEQMPDEVWTRRDYDVPVLNRGQRLDVVFLTTNVHGNQPVITVACDHPGVRLRLAVAKPMLWGEPQQESAWIGSLMALLLCWPILLFIPNNAVAVVLATILGIVAMLLGVATRKIGRLLSRLLS